MVQWEWNFDASGTLTDSIAHACMQDVRSAAGQGFTCGTERSHARAGCTTAAQTAGAGIHASSPPSPHTTLVFRKPHIAEEADKVTGRVTILPHGGVMSASHPVSCPPVRR